jgi:hypothetical protein
MGGGAMPTDDHPQIEEVVAFLRAKQACAIVHPNDQDESREVSIHLDDRSKWHVQALIFGFPRPDVRKRLKAAGLRIRHREMRMHFGPQRGTTVQFFAVARGFDHPEAAARAALAVLEILWALLATEWLWVTAMEYDDRGEPERPPVWPP